VAFGWRGLIRGVASLEGDNLVVLYYLCASAICTDKRVAFGWRDLDLIKRGTTVSWLSDSLIYILVMSSVKGHQILQMDDLQKKILKEHGLCVRFTIPLTDDITRM
jgi:hypothetical protein